MRKFNHTEIVLKNNILYTNSVFTNWNSEFNNSFTNRW